MNFFTGALCASLWFLASPSALAACIDGKSTHLFAAENSEILVGFTPSINPIAVGKHFSIVFEICSFNGKPLPVLVKIDADMPAHKHGMNYKPKVSKIAGGYLAEGMMFHMPGTWRVVFELEDNGANSAPVRIFRELRID
jgi:YtkA-like